MTHSFHGANLEFQNRGIHYLVNEVIKFRKQLTVRPEFKGQSGWTDALNNYMASELEKLQDTVASITYLPDEKTKTDIEMAASNVDNTLASEFNVRALTADNVLLAPFNVVKVTHDLSGNHLDIPQVDANNCPNDAGRSFIHMLDTFVVMCTRLDSRVQPTTITKDESAQLHALLNMLYVLLQRKGGEKMKSNIPVGTLPSQEAQTFNGVTK